MQRRIRRKWSALSVSARREDEDHRDHREHNGDPEGEAVVAEDIEEASAQPRADAASRSVPHLPELDLAEFFLEFLLDIFEKLFAAFEEALGLPGRVLCQGVGGEDGQGDGGVHVTDDGVG